MYTQYAMYDLLKTVDILIIYVSHIPFFILKFNV